MTRQYVGPKYEAARRIKATTGLSIREVCKAEGVPRCLVYWALGGDRESLEALRARLKPEVFSLLFPVEGASMPPTRRRAS
jgi:hypothetical protein